MQETIRRQQEQLRIQAEQIRAQSELLENLQKQVHALQQPQTPQPSAAVAPQPGTLPLTVTSGNDRIKVTLSGQVDRALNIVNDGGSTKLYHVDNNASNSRLRIIGTARINEDLSLGTRIEFAVAPDVSSQVSQTNQTPGTWFDQRWTELSLTSRTFGKLSLGKGDTASNTTAEMDLSRTDVVQYATIYDIAGGMLFRESAGDRPLTTLKVSDVFQSRDGLSRQSRLRYDTPALYGFSLAGSLATNQRYDMALFWNGEGYGIRAVGAFAVSNPRLGDSGLQYDGSLSVLHNATGLNLTLSGGLLARDTGEDATNLYGKLGWIASFTELGHTAFGIDYTRSANLPASDDRGYSVGAAVVQAFSRYATDLYLQYRLYSLDRRSGPSVRTLTVGTFGVRVKF
jgi:predicted porin